MKNLTVEFNVLKSKETYQKRDFLLSLIASMISNIPERCNFIDNFSTPMKVHKADDGMSQVIDSIFGYYIYLHDNEPSNTAFKAAAFHDLRGYLEAREGFSPRTKSYICYLKE